MSLAVVEDKIFQALSDPSRRAIFESLTRGEVAVKDLTARFDISQPWTGWNHGDSATWRRTNCLPHSRRGGRICSCRHARVSGLSYGDDWRGT